MQQLGLLEFYATSIFYKPDRWPYRIERYLPRGVRQRLHAEFRRFEHRGLEPDLVKTFGLFEWLERVAVRSGLLRLGSHFDRIGNRRFAQFLRDELRSPRPFALWGYNGSSLEVFRDARATGRFCILDRTIGDWRFYRETMAALAETHCDWFRDGYAVVDDYLISRDDAEYEAADLIVCGSDYCAATIGRYSPVAGVADKLRVLPYCYDATLFGNAPAPQPVDRSGPVRFLFVGQAGVRKGIHHVLEAIAQIPRSEAELTIVGHLVIPPQIFARYQDRVTYLPQVPRSQIPALMARHHAMVFPSYFEGSSLSLLEGLASGLALIQTPQAGNGVTADTGIRLDRPDTAQTLAAMRILIEDRERLDHYRSHAQAEARNYTFARYRENIAGLLSSIGQTAE